MAFDKYHVVRAGPNGHIEIKPVIKDGEQHTIMSTTIGLSGISVWLTEQGVLELIGCLADVAGLEEIGNVCADLGFEPA